MRNWVGGWVGRWMDVWRNEEVGGWVYGWRVCPTRTNSSAPSLEVRPTARLCPPPV